MQKKKKRLTPAQARTVQAYTQTGSQREAAKLLNVSQPNVSQNLQAAIASGSFDLDAFQEQVNRKFVERTWKLLDMTEDILERKLQELLDADSLSKEDASSFSKVIYDLRRSMQGASNFLVMVQQRQEERTVTTFDAKQEALHVLAEAYGLSVEDVEARLQG